MNIVLLIHSLDGGGAERVTTKLAARWANRGDKVTIVTISGPGRQAYTVTRGVEVQHLDTDDEGGSGGLRKGLQIRRRILAVRRALQRIAPDVAIGMMTTSAVLLAIASRGLPIRTIGAERNYPPALRLGTAWERARQVTYGWLDLVTAQTEQAAVWIREKTSAQKVSVIPNAAIWPLGDEPPIIAPDTVIPRSRRVILAAGRLDPQKGFDLLIPAFSPIAAAHPEWDLVILGEGPARSTLEQLAREQGAGSRVRLPGRAGNISEWYHRADVFALSSRFEGFPNVLLEAMSSGVAALSVDCPQGPSEIIRDGENGLLVAPNSAAALTVGLERMITDQALRSAFAKRARSVRDVFAEDSIMGKWDIALCGRGRHTEDTAASEAWADMPVGA